MTWSTGSPSTKRTEASEAGPGAAGAAPGPAFARAAAPPHLRLPRRPWLFAPLCGVLVALCAVLAAWHAPVRHGGAGFNLRAAPASSNVDSNSAGAAGPGSPAPPRPPLDTPPGGQEDLDKPHVIIGPGPAGLNQSPEPPPAELPPLPPAPPAPGGTPPPMTLAPLLPPAERHESDRDLQRGDSTMTHVKTLALPVALAAALSAQPLASAEDVEKPPTLEQTAKDVKDLKEAQKKSTDALLDELKKIQDQLKSMDGVRRDVDALRTTVQDLRRELELSAQMHNRASGDLTELRTQARQLRDDLDRAKTQASKMEQQLADQTARCDGLNRELAALRRQAADGSRQAARLTDGTGTIRLHNTFGRTVSIVLNGREPAYRLEPGETAVVNQVPVGSVTYEVLAPGFETPYRRTRTLTADNPLEIEVYDLARGPVRTPPRSQP